MIHLEYGVTDNTYHTNGIKIVYRLRPNISKQFVTFRRTGPIGDVRALVVHSATAIDTEHDKGETTLMTKYSTIRSLFFLIILVKEQIVK